MKIHPPNVGCHQLTINDVTKVWLFYDPTLAPTLRLKFPFYLGLLHATFTGYRISFWHFHIILQYLPWFQTDAKTRKFVLKNQECIVGLRLLYIVSHK